MAFDPGFLGYRHDPSTGGIFFKKPDGGELLFGGEEAERMAADVDRLRGPDMRTAAYDPSAPFGSTSSVPEPAPPPAVPDVPGGMSAPPDTGPAMSAMPQQAAHPPPEPPAQQAPTDGGQPQPGGAAPPQYVSSTGYPTGPNGDPLFPQPTEISQYKRVAARPGGYMPTAQSETVEGAKRYSPELIEGFKSVHEAEQKANIEGYRAQQAAFEQQRLQSEAALPELERAAIDAKIKQDIVQRDVATARQNLDQLAQEASEAKVGGGSIWGDGSGKATAGGVMTLISAALTSMGSAILGRGPTGMDVINNAIERDIAGQRAEVQRKGNKANNALAQYQRVFGDSQQAEMALRAVQQKQVANFAQRQAAVMGDAQAKQKAVEMAVAADNAYLKHAQQLEENVQGKSTQTVNAKYQAPSAGGIVRRTPEEMAREAKALREVGEYNRDAGAGFANSKPEQANAARQQQQYELKRRVTLPDGSFAYVPDDTIKEKVQTQINGVAQFKQNLNEQREMLAKFGSSLSPAMKGRYNLLQQANKVLIRDVEDLKNLTDSDYTLVDPFTGAGGNDVSLDPTKTATVLASMDGAERHAQFREDAAYKQLFREPGAQTFVKPTLGAQGITVDGAIAKPAAKPEEPEPQASNYPNLFGGGN